MHQILLIMGCYLGLIGAVENTPSEKGGMPESRKAAREDLKKLQGEWERVVMELEGAEVPADKFKGSVAVYEADQLTLKVGDQVYRRGIVIVDPSRTPKATNTWDQDGPFADQTVPGIYDLKGDTLKVCFAKPGQIRPTEFTTKQGTGFLYCVFKRRNK